MVIGTHGNIVDVKLTPEEIREKYGAPNTMTAEEKKKAKKEYMRKYGLSGKITY